MNYAGTILLLADRRRSHTDKALRAAGYRVMLSFTPDHAVAVCVSNQVDAVVVDQEHFVVTQNWSVAQSLKMIKPRICVVLMVRGEIVREEVPAGVDAIIAVGDTQALLSRLKELF